MMIVSNDTIEQKIRCVLNNENTNTMKFISEIINVENKVKNKFIELL